MFKAVIFDFNGVLANDEPVHMEAFQKVAAQEGLRISDSEYFERYLPFSDWDLFRNLFADRQRELDPDALDNLVERKAKHYYRILGERGQADGKSVLFPGARAAIEAAAELGPVGIASGARRQEIDFVLESGGLRNRFSVVVAAEDVEHGKPDPEPFLKAKALLDEEGCQERAGDYLAIEDSGGGVLAAKAAGLPCLAVEHSYDRSHLGDADWVIQSIEQFGDWLIQRAPS
jgi:beta-phosphoglucomutase